ncbi:hypothetical protein DSM112329_00953 [Paraconexibacter sp. AEG42_29]|uniref:HTH tetR-type domain-containing protein n=1 Tax=Paraconexibacter sp. AEG42_29 TaxID=2997339 RepID=A0AAU7AQZ8_9ACTN
MAATPPRARTRRLPPEERRRELLDAALDVITDDGFDAVSVEAVARRAGVTRPVIYDLFGDLDGLLVALLDREEEAALGPLLAIVGGDPGDDVEPEQFLVDGVAAFLEAVRANPRTWRLVLMPPRGSSPGLRERIARTRRLIAARITALLDWGVARRGGPLGLDHELFARLIVAAGEDAARLMLLHPRRYPPARLASIARDGLALVPAGSPRGTPPPPALVALAAAPAPALADGRPGETAPDAVAAAASAGAGRMPRAQRREQLLDVTLALLAEEGFDALNMEAVARRAGVNRAIVYRSFANVNLLLLALLRREEIRTRETLDALLPDDPAGHTAPELLALTLARFLTAVTQAPLTYRVVLQRPESAPLVVQKLVSRRRAVLAERLEPLVQWGLAGISAETAGIDVDIVARMLLSVGEELARLTLDDAAYPPERIAASAWALLDVVPLG